VAMCISLCISTVVAMTLSPALCSRIMKVPVPEDKRPKIFAPFNIGLNFTRNVYLAGVKLLVRRALLTLILLAAAAFFNWSLFKSIPGSFIPGEDKGAFFCDIQMAPGATLARTREVVEEYSRKMQKLDGVREVLSVSGFSFLNGEAENNGLLIVQLDNWDKRKDPALEVNKIMQKAQIEGAKDPAARIICFTPPAIMGLGLTGGASFMLSGDGTVNASALSDTAKQFNMELMKRYPGKILYSNTGYNADTPQLYFDLDRAKAESLGVPVSTIFSTLQSKLASFYVNDFNLQGYAFNVKIQSDILDRGTIDDINNIEIPNKNGEMVPLNALGRVSYIVGPRQIQRFNKLISADMKAQGNGISSGELMNLIETVPLPEGYTINWTDMSYQERENQGQIVFLMGLAMLFAYLFLVAQYESWTVPVPVMLSVLFATLGALIGLKLWGEPLSIYAQLGLVMLVGLAAKNAILMVEFSKQERENGVPIFEAAVNGANLRYRAVLMTAWSFIFGVYPLVIATGAGAGSRRAIGIPTFSGMLFATFVGLFFVPALYAACQRAREYVNSKLFRKQ
ncbi:MAG: efflux RND transporter permease subunit, partial [Lentisphaeria bacterium]|nr:efflux RND transporter permease subunit [Lentisphaeria bacterium]